MKLKLKDLLDVIAEIPEEAKRDILDWVEIDNEYQRKVWFSFGVAMGVVANVIIGILICK